MDWFNTVTESTRRAVAYYRHSAQDRQENSVEIQQDQVRQFALEHNIEIIREFADKGEIRPFYGGTRRIQRTAQRLCTGREGDIRFCAGS